MTQDTETMAVSRTVTVAAPPERAFAVFTDGFDTWWPRSHSIAEAELAEATLEPRLGGRWYERGADGSETEWGKVLAWDPPHRLVVSWHIGGSWGFEDDPARYSEIEVTFTPDGDGTRVELTHGHLERHTAPEALRDSVGGEGGWGGLLERYSAAVG
jgi:uncharacterized protein YndB with AHSA1/START domain